MTMPMHGHDMAMAEALVTVRYLVVVDLREPCCVMLITNNCYTILVSKIFFRSVRLLDYNVCFNSFIEKQSFVVKYAINMSRQPS